MNIDEKLDLIITGLNDTVIRLDKMENRFDTLGNRFENIRD